jgi:hypothetical protein
VSQQLKELPLTYNTSRYRDKRSTTDSFIDVSPLFLRSSSVKGEQLMMPGRTSMLLLDMLSRLNAFRQGRDKAEVGMLFPLILRDWRLLCNPSRAPISKTISTLLARLRETKGVPSNVF